jgi:hypothetical protein
MRQQDERLVIPLTLANLAASRHLTMWSACDAHYDMNADDSMSRVCRAELT